MSSDLTHTFTAMTREIVDQLLEEGGQVRAGQVDAQTALNCFLKAAELELNSAVVRNNLGIAYWELRDSDKALEHLRQAALLNPNEASFTLNCGEVLVTKEKFGQAESLYKRFLKSHIAWSLLKQCMFWKTARQNRAVMCLATSPLKGCEACLKFKTGPKTHFAEQLLSEYVHWYSESCDFNPTKAGLPDPLQLPDGQEIYKRFRHHNPA